MIFLASMNSRPVSHKWKGSITQGVPSRPPTTSPTPSLLTPILDTGQLFVYFFVKSKQALLLHIMIFNYTVNTCIICLQFLFFLFTFELRSLHAWTFTQF